MRMYLSIVLFRSKFSDATKMPAIFTSLSLYCFNCLLFISSGFPLNFYSHQTKFTETPTTYIYCGSFMSVCEESCEFQSPRAAELQPQRVSKKRTGQDDTSFRGVRKRRWGRYVSEIRLPGQKTRIWLGSFRSPEMAARAYDSAAFFLKGDSAILNFPDLVGSLPRPESCSRRDIQSAAAKASLQEPVGNGGRFEHSVSTVSDEDPECFAWWDDLGTVAFEEVKGGPLLSPLMFDTMDGELCFFMDHDDFLTSCFEF